MSRWLFCSCWVILGLAVASSAGAQGAGLTSGQPIPVGTADRLGPLAAVKIVNLPVGAAHVFGKQRPDLFVIAGSRFYPDMVLFPWRETTGDGVPVFDPPLPVHAPEYVKPGNPGTVFEQDGTIHALWLSDGAIVHLTFDRNTVTFVELQRVDLPQLPRGPSVIGCLPDRDGPGFQLLFGITDGVRSTPPMEGFTSSRDPRYDPYDGAGVWRGGFPYMTMYTAHVPALLEGPVSDVRQIAASPREVRNTYESLTHVDLGPGRANDVIGGSVFGPLYYYHASSNNENTFEPYRNVVGPDGIILRHPTIGPRPTAYPNAEGRWSDLIVGGEGALYFYRYLDRHTEAGQPVYRPPVPALQHDAELYAGTLPVVNVVDWDGDGALDMVAGNSEGRVLFFHNEGTTAAPAFRPGIPLEAGGHPIFIQSGYRGSIQGPGEARWGYVCPTVADWNSDGLPDLLMSDATAKHRVYLNEGTRTKPRLAVEHTLYLDGLELHGTWRVQPAVASLAGRMAYIALDDDDEFHLYHQLDVFNLEDAGKLKLESAGVIGANYLKSGGTGRIKITLTDWDRDGRTDLLVGTPRHASIPDPERGLPQSLGLPGAAVLLLRNAGSDAAPVFAQPELLTFRGEPFYFGQHACSPAVAAFGEAAQPGLIVGVETGRVLYFSRSDIDFTSPNP